MNSQFEAERKKMTSWALRVTILYIAFLGFLAVTLAAAGRAAEIGDMKPNEVGDLLAGVGGPFALIWLVYGYFLQGLAIRQQAEELIQNTRALHLQEEALRAQTEAFYDSQRPKLIVRCTFAGAGKMNLIINNAGASASNLVIIGSDGFGSYRNQTTTFLPANEERSFLMDSITHLSGSSPLNEEKHWISIQFEYGAGYKGEEIFDFVNNPGSNLGQFINRKSVAGTHQ